MENERRSGSDHEHIPSAARSQYDPYSLPDFDNEFITPEELEAFAKALTAPTTAPVTALNDWRPIHQRIKRSKKRKVPRRSKDETREGFSYSIFYWPVLLGLSVWIGVLFFAYNITRLYIYFYEHVFSWRGKRQRLRQDLQKADTYDEWQQAAHALDAYLGNEKWKHEDENSYYNHTTVRNVNAQLSILLGRLEAAAGGYANGLGGAKTIDELKTLLESCIKNNFVGVESSRLYSETYIGTKDLVQTFVDRVHQGLQNVLESDQISARDKNTFFRSLELNYGRTALCLSGGATFAYYHFGVVKALTDARELPEIICGTSGGALVAALVATRTDEELEQLLVPALAYRIKACQDSISVWLRRWWKTGARFDGLDWAKQCAWFCHGSLTFREAYRRTGRILNVTCVPSDPHSPVLLNNHITSPDCVVWSAVLASAAVPGILNPVVLMKKTRDGTLMPYSFGNKWKDGSLRTDIPLKSLNIHFNVNFPIVSQVNPHINLFFFAPRGSPGRPVTHRKGRGWRGGFLGSLIEMALKLEMEKGLKILRHLELLPRIMGQDWSELWLQRFSGSITIWPKTVLSDFWSILSDPSPRRLERMIRAGERSCWPKVRFISNRMKIESVILEGLRTSTPESGTTTPSQALEQQNLEAQLNRVNRPNRGVQLSRRDSASQADSSGDDTLRVPESPRRQSSVLEEFTRQASVLWNDDGPPTEVEDGITTDDDVLIEQDGETKGL